MFRNKLGKTGVAALAAASVLALAACGGNGGSGSDNTGGGGGGGDLIKVGFSQLGAESGLRTANTESVKASLAKENGIDLTFVDDLQKQDNQVKALRYSLVQD